MSQEAVPFELQSLIRIIQGFASLDRNADDDNLPDVETAGSLLWDLTTDPDTVVPLLQCNLVAAVHDHLRKCNDVRMQATLSAINLTIQRLLELCFGILANLYAFPGAVLQLVADEAALLAMLDILRSIDDPPALSELCRMLTSAVSSTRGRSAWLPILQHQQQVLAHLMLLIQSTLNSQLLQRSLELVTALLHTSTTSAGDGADGAAEDNASTAGSNDVSQHLWTAGLADALSAVLVNAAAAPAKLASHVANDTAAGGWDDEPDTAAAADGNNIELIEQKLYRKPEVLEALVGVLEQVAMQPNGVDTAVQHLPELPQLLLQLLAACNAAGQQEVLELLLPVLVMFRAVLLPLLQQQERPWPASRNDAGIRQQQQQEQEEEEQGIQHKQRQQGLQYMVCIAGVLQDCSSPDSLDALDAGWYLCAAATRGLWQQQQQSASAAASRGAEAQHQQGTSAATSNSSTPTAVSCRLLEQFGKRLSLARVPETAVGYAEQCVRNIMQAIAAAVEEQSIAAADSSADSAVVSCMIRTADHVAAALQTVQHTVQQQQDTPAEVLLQQIASIDQVQQDWAAMREALTKLQEQA